MINFKKYLLDDLAKPLFFRKNEKIIKFIIIIIKSNYSIKSVILNSNSIYDLLYGLEELDAFPLIMPVSGEISTQQEVEEFWEWLRAFESIGIDMYKNISYGFDIKEPKCCIFAKEHSFSSATLLPFSVL